MALGRGRRRRGAEVAEGGGNGVAAPHQTEENRGPESEAPNLADQLDALEERAAAAERQAEELKRTAEREKRRVRDIEERAHEMWEKAVEVERQAQEKGERLR